MFCETLWSRPLGSMAEPFFGDGILWQLIEVLQQFLAIAFINWKLNRNGVIKKNLGIKTSKI